MRDLRFAGVFQQEEEAHLWRCYGDKKRINQIIRAGRVISEMWDENVFISRYYKFLSHPFILIILELLYLDSLFLTDLILRTKMAHGPRIYI